jgi:hypothetical protein
VRLDDRIDRVEKRLVEGEVRTATAIHAVAAAVNDVKQLLADRLDLRANVWSSASATSRT